MKPIIIPINLIDLPNERIIEQRIATITLHDTHLDYHIYLKSERSKDDAGLVWEPAEISNLRMTFIRHCIGAVNFFRANTAQCWKLEIECSGAADAITVNYKTEKLGLPAYEIIKRYVVGFYKPAAGEEDIIGYLKNLDK